MYLKVRTCTRFLHLKAEGLTYFFALRSLDPKLIGCIIAVSATKLKLLQVYNAKLSGYHFYHKGTTTRWGGVGFFIKESLSISICKDFDLNIPNCEDMWIQLDLGNNKKCIVGVIYRHPKQKSSEFCKSFESTIEKLNSRKLMYYIGGDFIADLLKVTLISILKIS